VLTRSGWTFGAIALVSLLAGIVMNFAELVGIGLAFLACVILAVAWLGRRPAIEVSRELAPSRVNEGDGSTGVLTIKNNGSRRSPPVLAVERFAGGSVSVPVPGLASGATHVVGYRLPADRRGCYAVGPLAISHSDPLHLVNSTQTFGAEATLWVHPRVSRVAPIPTGRSQELEGPKSDGAPRGGIAFHSLREYEPGDDLRMIHWRSSARTGTLMVKHTVITNEPRLLLVLDTSASSYEGDSFEDAVRVVASLLAAGVEKRFPTTLRSTGGLRATVDPTGLGKTDAMDKLAAVQVGDDAGLEELVKFVSRREQGVAMGVVTGQPTREQALAVGRVRSRFDMVTMIQVGERFGRPPMDVPGVAGVNVASSEDFVRTWGMRGR
jgi:uncharacterized protein (DUF58 family)